MKQLLLSVTTAAVFLTGCSSLGLGESEYSCKGYTEGYTCLSAREVYELNQSGHTDAPGDHAGHNHAAANERAANSPVLSKDERLSGGYQTSRQAEQHSSTAQSTQQTVQTLAPSQYMGISRITPIRTPAQVMRIWVDTYEDDAGDLHTPGIVYTEVQARSWQVGQPAPVRSQRIRATKPLARPAPGTTPQTTAP